MSGARRERIYCSGLCLDEIINMNHELVLVGEKRVVETIEARCGEVYSDDLAMPPLLRTRLMAGSAICTHLQSVG